MTPFQKYLTSLAVICLAAALVALFWPEYSKYTLFVGPSAVFTAVLIMIITGGPRRNGR